MALKTLYDQEEPELIGENKGISRDIMQIMVETQHNFCLSICG